MFAIPMIGAVIHTVNVRLSPEQIAYTINHADDRLVLVNSEFTALYQAMSGHLNTVEKTLLLTDLPDKSADLPNPVGEYETLLAAASPEYVFDDFDENSVATTFYTTGTTGNPKGVYFTHRQLVLHTMGVATIMGCIDSTRLLGTDDVYMPITPMFHACLGHSLCGNHARSETGVPRPLRSRVAGRAVAQGESHLLPLRADHPANAPERQVCSGRRFRRLEDHHWRQLLTRSLYQAAKSRGIQLTAAYGMSETGPLISVAHINEELKAGSEDERITYRIKAGVPGCWWRPPSSINRATLFRPTAKPKASWSYVRPG